MNKFGDELKPLLEVLPPVLKARLESSPDISKLIEVVMDYGRPAEARYMGSVERFADIPITEFDIECVTKDIGSFGSDNRAGIERTLHRISCIRNRHGKIIGLTCRIGRSLEGTIDMIDDIVRSGKSLLLLGRPGVGKTTKLREVARVLADEVGRRVVIVDTSNEIAGDGDVPHPGIGSARRMQVAHASEQHQVMIEAVENHMPEVVVIDEIGTEQEAMAARTIAERGVQLVGTAHGQTLENLMLNPTLADLIGGIQAVTLSDDEARRRGTQKTVLERKAPPTFDVVIELLDFDRLAVHADVQRTVDMILRGLQPRPEIRVRTKTGVEVLQKSTVPEELEQPFEPVEARPSTPPAPTPNGKKRVEPTNKPAELRIFPYGIAKSRLERAIKETGASAVLVSDPAQADSVLALKVATGGKAKKFRDNAGRSLHTVTVKSNAFGQILAAVEELMRLTGTQNTTPAESEALDEVLDGIESVLLSGKPKDLMPKPSSIRKVQHQVAEARKLASESVGQEPNRFVRILNVRLP
ncbi:MAG: R3H domain-containing nucleic acid-binding protein [Fimbriimonadaceae bacterium]